MQCSTALLLGVVGDGRRRAARGCVRLPEGLLRARDRALGVLAGPVRAARGVGAGDSIGGGGGFSSGPVNARARIGKAIGGFFRA